MDLQKCERFVDEVSGLYREIIAGNSPKGLYKVLVLEFRDVDSFGILKDVYKLRLYPYQSRSYRRLRNRIDRKAEKFKCMCERELSSDGI